jgi:hypothetical protein
LTGRKCERKGGLYVTIKDVDKNKRIEDGDMRKILKEMEPYIEATRSQMSMMKGVVLGLFYGIVGNLVVTHYYQILRGVVMSEFDTMFWTNLAILVPMSSIIAIVSWKWHISMAKTERAMELLERTKQEFSK